MLEMPQRDARDGVAGDHDDAAALGEEPLGALLGEVEDVLTSRPP